ncbi:MAG: drug/metabolite transporter (DMT)-like permease [Saprospiraceae bacterium]
MSNTIKGIFLVSFGLLLFAIQDSVIKSFSDQYAVLQIVFIRSAAGVFVLLIGIAIFAGGAGLKSHNVIPQIMKYGLSFGAYLCYYLALADLPLAETATITFLSPLIVTALSAIIFKEHVGLHRWGAVVVGFFAIILVVGPQGHFGNPAVLFALTAAFAYALSIIATRFLDARDSAITSAFYGSWVHCILAIVCTMVITVFFKDNTSTSPSVQFLTRDWLWMDLNHFLLLAALGVMISFGLYCLVKAYRIIPFSLASPFEYTYILWSVILGYLMWGDVPQSNTLVGIVLLVISNLYILQRELKHNKKELTQPNQGRI